MFIWPFDPEDFQGKAAPWQPSAQAAAPSLPAGFVKAMQAQPAHLRLLLPGESDYEKWRGTFNLRFAALMPSAIALCLDEAGVAVCLDALSTYKVPFRLRSRGHSFGGYSSTGDGVIVNVSALQSRRVDAATLEALFAAGCSQKQVQQELAPSGLLLPLGGGPVGVGGYVEGGGFGLNSRTLGMNSDRVLEMRVMLADGRVVRANEQVNHDLWWALRGGTGGNFGVLLDVRYALAPAAENHGWSLSWPIRSAADRSRAADALLTLQEDVLIGAGAGLNAQADLRRWPDTNGGPPGTLRLYLSGQYFGSEANMESLIAPLRKLPGHEPFTMCSAVMMPLLRKARFLSTMPSADWKSLVDDFADYAASVNAVSSLTMDAWGGAIGAYPREASAFVHRSAFLNMYVTGLWNTPQDEANLQQYLARWQALTQPFWNGGVFQNFADPDCDDYRAAYWGDAFAALLAVKRKYDPDKLFDFPQAVRPRPGEPDPVPTWPPKVVEWLSQPVQV